MKHLGKTLGGIGGVVVGLVGILVLLVQWNRMPAAMAKRMPGVKTFTVEGDVRMSDGKSLPTGEVEILVRTPLGKTARVRATEKTNYHYTATLMGFSAPVQPGDSVHLRAFLTLPPQPQQTKSPSEEITPSENITSLNTRTLRVLLADFDVPVGGSSGGDSAELPTRLRAISSVSSPSTLAEWQSLPLASLDALPHLQIDEDVSLSVEIQRTRRIPNEPPLEIRFPPAPDEETLRQMPLSAIGEELARTPLTWEKKRPHIPLTYTAPRPGVVTVQILSETGVSIRTQQISLPAERRYPRTLSWEWDGKNEQGDYLPEGTYTFVAGMGSLSLGSSPSSYVAETTQQDGTTVLRYVELSLTHRVGDLIEACGVPLRRDRRGNFEFAVPVRLYRVTLEGKPERKEARFKGNDTLGTVTERFGLKLDLVPESVTHVARYRLVVRGGTLRGKPSLNELRSRTSVQTQTEFLALPLSHVEIADTGEPLVPDFQNVYTLTYEVPPPNPEWGDRPTRQTTSIVVTPSTTVQQFLDQLNQVPGITATIRGSTESLYRFGARLTAPEGAKFRWMRLESTGEKIDHVVTNIRAAGVLVRVLTDGVTPLGDGVTRVPIEARVIGLDGKEITGDTVTGTAMRGTLSNGGLFRSSNGAYLAEYVPPVTPKNLPVTIEVTSRALSDKSAEGVSASARGEVVVNVVGFSGTSPVTATPSSTPEESRPPETTSSAVEETSLPETTVSNAPPLITPTGMNVEEVRKLAKVYSRMSPKRASELLLSLSTEQARSVLLNMKDRDAAKIFDAILGSAEEEEEDLFGDPTALREREIRKQALLNILEGRRSSSR